MRLRSRATRPRRASKTKMRAPDSAERTPDTVLHMLRVLVVRAATSRRNQPLQLLDSRRPDPGDRVELVHGGERTVRLAVVENLLRGHRADARERIELLQCGGVQVDGAGRGGAASRPADRGARSSTRDDDLLTVRDGCGEVDELELSLARWS